MRSVGRWLLVAIAVAAALALAYGAYQRAAQAWDGVVSYESPYTDLQLPASGSGPAAVDRVVYIIIDGLRADAADSMSSIRALRGYGATFTLRAPEPSLSYPNWTTLFSGTTQDHHGVVTNWHEGAAPVETLFDVAERAGISYAVVGPSDIATLYPAATRASGSFFREWSDEYLSGTYVDETLDISKRVKPSLIVLHLPDIDEAGHDFGGTSPEYAQTVARVDSEVRRLVEGLQDSRTAFVIVADHGHIATGGHGGWEPEVVDVSGVFAGPGISLTSGEARQEDVAPTVAVLAGLPVPRMATGQALESVFATPAVAGLAAERRQREAAVTAFVDALRAPIADGPASADVSGAPVGERLDAARAERLAFDRRQRATGPGLWFALTALAALGIVGVLSWRALVASLAGTAAYYAFYNVLFFLVHGNRWSLSAFNSEDAIDAWMNQRLIEAAIAGIVAALVAGLVYPLLRRVPKGPSGRYLPGWLALGPVTVLVAQLTLLLQVAWFEWAWGISPAWGLPDLKWGFKFDLDLIQMTALGGAALLAPVVSYLVGRYHPRVRKTAAGRA